MWTGNMFQGFSFQVRTLEKHQQANFTVYLADFLRTNVEEFAVRHLCEKEPKGAKRQGFLRPISPKSHQRRKRKGGKKKNEEEETRRRERDKKPMVALCFSILAPLESFWPKKMLDGRGLFGGNVFSKIRLDVMYCNIRIPLRSIITLGRRTINYHQLCFSYLTQGPMFRCLSKVNEHGVAKQLIRGNLMSRKALPQRILGSQGAIHQWIGQDRLVPTGKVSKKWVHLLRWTTFPGRTGWNFG